MRMYSMLKLALTRNSWLPSARDLILSSAATINAGADDEMAQIGSVSHRHVNLRRALAPDGGWFSDPLDHGPLWVSKTSDQVDPGGNSSRCENQQLPVTA